MGVGKATDTQRELSLSALYICMICESSAAKAACAHVCYVDYIHIYTRYTRNRNQSIFVRFNVTAAVTVGDAFFFVNFCCLFYFIFLYTKMFRWMMVLCCFCDPVKECVTLYALTVCERKRERREETDRRKNNNWRTRERT